MSLGFNYAKASSEDRVPIVKYNAKAGRIFRVDRTQTAQGWESSEEEVTNGFQAIFDMENIEIGWLDFPPGGAPSIVTQHLSKGFPERPSPKHKQGVRIMMKLGKSVANGQPAVREFSSSAVVVLKSIDALYEAYKDGVAANPGKLPAVKLVSSTGVKSGSGDKSTTNYMPTWQIVSWVDRPSDLMPRAATSTAPAAVSGPPSTGSTATPPPAQRAPAMADADSDFG